MACPHVAGAMTLLLAQTQAGAKRSPSPSQLREEIAKAATPSVINYEQSATPSVIASARFTPEPAAAHFTDPLPRASAVLASAAADRHRNASLLGSGRSCSSSDDCRITEKCCPESGLCITSSYACCGTDPRGCFSSSPCCPGPPAFCGGLGQTCCGQTSCKSGTPCCAGGVGGAHFCGQQNGECCGSTSCKGYEECCPHSTGTGHCAWLAFHKCCAGGVCGKDDTCCNAGKLGEEPKCCPPGWDCKPGGGCYSVLLEKTPNLNLFVS